MSTLARVRWRYVWLVLGGLILAAAFYFDASVQSWVELHRTLAIRGFMRTVSRWGDWPSHVVVGLLGTVMAYFLSNRRWLAIFLAMTIACAVAGSLNRVIKISAGRARPTVKVEAGWNGPNLSSKYHAFPSGHAACSTAFFGTLCFARRRIGPWFLPIPALIAASRIYLGAHFLSDVVFAAALGVICALVVWQFVSGRMRDVGTTGAAGFNSRLR